MIKSVWNINILLREIQGLITINGMAPCKSYGKAPNVFITFLNDLS